MENQEKYTVLELAKWGGNLTVSKRDFRPLEKGEILVKIMCCTIHPADLAFLHGSYGSKRPELLPVVPGMEGSGEIVQVGEGVDMGLIGMRCNVIADLSRNNAEGMWAQYHYTYLPYLTVFNTEINFERICFAAVNPITAVGFLDTLQKQNAKCVGQNGASSAFAKIFIRLCAKEGIKTLNIVRNEKHIPTLKSLGADEVFNSSTPNWDKEFQQAAQKENLQHFFECVGGDTTGTVFSLLPNNSTLYHYGNLELKRVGNFTTTDFIFKRKVLRGWWLSEWIHSLTSEELVRWKGYIVKDLMSESDMFTTSVSQTFTLEEYEKAFEFYLTNMSEGKIVMRPN